MVQDHNSDMEATHFWGKEILFYFLYVIIIINGNSVRDVCHTQKETPVRFFLSRNDHYINYASLTKLPMSSLIKISLGIVKICLNCRRIILTQVTLLKDISAKPVAQCCYWLVKQMWITPKNSFWDFFHILFE